MVSGFLNCFTSIITVVKKKYWQTIPHTYDETIKTLGKKDYVALAEFALPFVKDANEITLESINLSIPGMLEVDFLTEVNFKDKKFIMHVEFESSYNSNSKMEKRMLRYYTYIKWNSDLPIYQILVVLKKPVNIKNISDGFSSSVHNFNVMQYKYKVIKAYEIDNTTISKKIFFLLTFFYFFVILHTLIE